MDADYKNRNVCAPQFFDISDDDILKAMKEIKGYLDITTGDFKTLYRLAYAQALERLTHLIKARDVMNEKVICVDRDTLSEEVALIMATHRVAGVPVIEKDKKVVGVISEKDFLSLMAGDDSKSFMDVIARCLKDRGCVALTVRRRKAEDFMSAPPVTVGPDIPISKIAGIFSEKNINRVPVVDGEGRLVGIVARADLVGSSFPRDSDGDEEKNQEKRP